MHQARKKMRIHPPTLFIASADDDFDSNDGISLSISSTLSHSIDPIDSPSIALNHLALALLHSLPHSSQHLLDPTHYQHFRHLLCSIRPVLVDLMGRWILHAHHLPQWNSRRIFQALGLLCAFPNSFVRPYLDYFIKHHLARVLLLVKEEGADHDVMMGVLVTLFRILTSQPDLIWEDTVVKSVLVAFIATLKQSSSTESNVDVMPICLLIESLIWEMTPRERDTLFKKHLSQEQCEWTQRLILLNEQLDLALQSDLLLPVVDQGEPEGNRLLVSQQHVCSLTHLLGSMLLPNLPTPSTAPSDPHSTQAHIDPYILTPTTHQNLCTLLKHLTLSPLLHLSPTPGKSHLVSVLARFFGRRLLRLASSAFEDPKSLIAVHRWTTDGSVRVDKGVLVKAIQQGWWIWCDVSSSAHAMGQDVGWIWEWARKVGGSGRRVKVGEWWVRPHPEFRVFASASSASPQASSTGMDTQHGWVHVDLEPLSDDEWVSVLRRKFDKLSLDVCRWLIKSLDFFRSKSAEMKWSRAHGRSVGLRDLIHWARRIHVEIDERGDDTQGSSMGLRQLIFKHAGQLFLSPLSDWEYRRSVALAYASWLNLPESTAIWMEEQRVPESLMDQERGVVSMGDVLLKRSEFGGQPVQTAQQGGPGSASSFALTTHAVKLLEKMSTSVHPELCEPLLLVGETGTGKTTQIQYLASLLGVKLHVFNMSQQSDATDLLGGFKPVDIRAHFVLPLKDQFDTCFKNTFSVRENGKFVEACRIAVQDGRGNV